MGVPKVTEMALHAISKASVVLCTSKGFWTDPDGRVQLLPDATRTIAAENGALLPPIVGVGGPCKANEVAQGKPTATIYGSLSEEAALRMAREISTEVYRIEPTTDEPGVEVCAPMKNVYAIALGMIGGFLGLIVPSLSAEVKTLTAEGPHLKQDVRERWLPALDQKVAGWVRGNQVGMTDQEVRQSSFMRLLRALANPHDAALQRSPAFEFECANAAAKRSGDGAVAVGVRAPIGISFDLNRTPLDIFVELALVGDLLIDRDDRVDAFDHNDGFYFDVNAAVGLRLSLIHISEPTRPY